MKNSELRAVRRALKKWPEGFRPSPVRFVESYNRRDKSDTFWMFWCDVIDHTGRPVPGASFSGATPSRAIKYARSAAREFAALSQAQLDKRDQV